MAEEVENEQLELIESFDHADLFLVKTKSDTLIVKSKSNYIPENKFREIFGFITTNIMTSKVIKKLIFDKRSLSVFNQNSMEWYYTEWKNEAASLGLDKHRKILPENELFNKSVKIGKEKIEKEFPNAVYKKLDIQYCDSVETAITI
ncbi:hypothetical protein [Marinigracilibium pacificum]|uniref:Uncharacterized protein n=1 Tax=Marinigracilibium pacificum TaxID=2729599 RepID=A0A848J7N3_9BACT|nr:hypothetical protein [Marinigracilibium pacificum]NMM49112.1 hypothetical protein [Marinigracilibium pacificum]